MKTLRQSETYVYAHAQIQTHTHTVSKCVSAEFACGCVLFLFIMCVLLLAFVVCFSWCWVCSDNYMVRSGQKATIGPTWRRQRTARRSEYPLKWHTNDHCFRYIRLVLLISWSRVILRSFALPLPTISIVSRDNDHTKRRMHNSETACVTIVIAVANVMSSAFVSVSWRSCERKRAHHVTSRARHTESDMLLLIQLVMWANGILGPLGCFTTWLNRALAPAQFQIHSHTHTHIGHCYFPYLRFGHSSRNMRINEDDLASICCVFAMAALWCNNAWADYLLRKWIKSKRESTREKNWNIDHLLAYRKATNWFRKSFSITNILEHTNSQSRNSCLYECHAHISSAPLGHTLVCIQFVVVVARVF